MIKRLSVITMVMVMLLFANMYAEQAEPSEQNVSMEIQGMSCSLWPIAIKKSLEGIKGVSDVKVSFEKEKAWLTADESVPDEALIEAVQKAGPYKGKVIERKKGGK